VLGNDLSKVGIVHVLGEDFLVLLHAVDDQPFERLDEDVAEVVQRVRRGGPAQLLVSDRFFPKLVEEQFVRLGKVSAEALVDGVDEPG
jgi:hypothetical protein